MTRILSAPELADSMHEDREMDFDAYVKSLAQPAPPEALSGTLLALWRDAHGDWDAAHGVVQELSSPEAAWVHAYLHRKEGDLANAGCWCQRAGQAVSEESLADEWDRLVKMLL